MSDLISRAAAIDTAMNDRLIINAMDSVKDGDMHRTKRAIVRLLASLPTAERAGKWIKVGRSLDECSVCGDYVDFASQNGYHYCPHCGARMSEGEEG